MVKSIKQIISNVPDNSDDQRWYQEMFLSESGKKYMALDYNCEIFQCLNDAEEEIDIHYSKSRVFNKKNNTYPCQIHGNGPQTRKTFLNRLESYLMKNWTDIWGYNKKNLISPSNLKKDISIYINIIHLHKNDSILKNIMKNIQNNIDVVKKYVNINAIFSNIKDLNRNNGMKNALKMNVDYYWLIDTTYIITKKKGNFYYWH